MELFKVMELVLEQEQVIDFLQVQNQGEPLFLFYLNILLALRGQFPNHLILCCYNNTKYYLSESYEMQCHQKVKEFIRQYNKPDKVYKVQNRSRIK